LKGGDYLKPTQQEKIMLFTTQEQSTIDQAISILESKVLNSDYLTSPSAVRNFLRVKLGSLDHEEFFVVWLSNSHQVIAVDRMAIGDLSNAAVYPRQIYKRALQVNCAAALIAHSHPNNCSDPSLADKNLTKVLKEGLTLIGEIRLLDHFIITKNSIYSFAENGLL
jgi:DNA repair protein RadC